MPLQDLRVGYFSTLMQKINIKCFSTLLIKLKEFLLFKVTFISGANHHFILRKSTICPILREWDSPMWGIPFLIHAPYIHLMRTQTKMYINKGNDHHSIGTALWNQTHPKFFQTNTIFISILIAILWAKCTIRPLLVNVWRK